MTVSMAMSSRRNGSRRVVFHEQDTGFVARLDRFVKGWSENGADEVS